MATNWRQLTASDLPALLRVQEEAYPAHQERAEVFLDRMALYPQGCLALDGANGLDGYILSHPWRRDHPPPLGAVLGVLPEVPETYYLHDLALPKRAQGVGQGARLVRHLVEHAGATGFRTLSLVAVNGSSPFWERQGFGAPELADGGAKLAVYGADAVYMVRDLREAR